MINLSGSSVTILRSPLGAITAGAALLAHAAADDQRQARVAARILNSAQR